MWAHALTVTATGLDKHEKDAIKADVEAGGGRYSPNLSRRTTHLVTPEVVNSITEKLAVAAAPGQQKFKALHVVSKCWVSASTGLQCRADETQFAPLVPPTTATDEAQRHRSRQAESRYCNSAGPSRLPAESTAPPPAAAPQTPWVVHFSQLPADSVYDPDPGGEQQLQQSPCPNQQLVQQLHLQLSPIAEGPDGSQLLPVPDAAWSTPYWAGQQQQQQPEQQWRQQQHYGYQQQQQQRQQQDASATPPESWGNAWQQLQQPQPPTVDSSSSTPSGRTDLLAVNRHDQQAQSQAWNAADAEGLKQLQQCPEGLQALRLSPHLAPLTHLQADTAAEAAEAEAAAAATPMQGLTGGPAAFRYSNPLQQSPLAVEPVEHAAALPGQSTAGASGRTRPLPLWLPPGSSISCPGSSQASPGPTDTSGLGWPAQQQQQQQPTGLLDQLWAADGSSRYLKRLSTQGYTSLAVAAAAGGGSATAQKPLQPPWQQQQQQQQPSGFSVEGHDRVDELIASLEHIKNGSVAGSGESVELPAGNPAAANASSSGLDQQSCQVQGGLVATTQAAASTAAAKAAAAVSGGMVDGSSTDNTAGAPSSIDDLLKALRRVTGDSRVEPAAAGVSARGEAAPTVSPVSARPPVRYGALQVPGTEQQQGLQPAAFDHQQQQQQQVLQRRLSYWGSASGAASSSTARAAAAEPAAAAPATEKKAVDASAASPAQSMAAAPAPLDLEQLLGMLHRATGDSRRVTTETAVAATPVNDATAVPEELSTAGKHGMAGTLCCHVAQAAAVPLPLSQESPTVAPTAVKSPSAAYDRLVHDLDELQLQQCAVYPQGHQPDLLLQQPQQPQQQQQQVASMPGRVLTQQPTAQVQQWEANIAVEQPPAGTGSYSSVADLIAALRRATGESRRSTAEALLPIATEAETGAAAAAAADAVSSDGFSAARDAPWLSLHHAAANKHGNSSCSSTGTGKQTELGSDVDGLISALQCIAAASKLQTPAAAAAAGTKGIASAKAAQAAQPQADTLRGSDYEQLVRHLSKELGDLNRDAALRDDSVLGQEALQSPAQALASDSPQDVQQLIDALRRATTENAAQPDHQTPAAGPDAAKSDAEAKEQLYEGSIEMPVESPVRQWQRQGQWQQQQQQQRETLEQLQHERCDESLIIGTTKQQAHLCGGLTATCTTVAATARPTPEMPASIVGRLQLQQHQQQQLSLTPPPTQQQQQQQQSQAGSATTEGGPVPFSHNSSSVLELILALRHATGDSRRGTVELTTDAGADVTATATAASTPPAVATEGITSQWSCTPEAKVTPSLGEQQGTSSRSKRLLQLLSTSPVQQAPEQTPQYSIHNSSRSHPERSSKQATPLASIGGRQAPAARVTAGVSSSENEASVLAGAPVEQLPAAVQWLGPASVAGGAEDAVPLQVTPLLQSRTVAQCSPQQIHQARAMGEGRQLQLADLSMAQQQQQSAAEADTPGQRWVLSSMRAVFDPMLSDSQRCQLQEAVAALGGSVVAGLPHLGCGANTIVAEPASAAKWLPLLLDIVSPGWLAKACKQQRKAGMQALQRAKGTPAGSDQAKAALSAAGAGAAPKREALQLVRMSPDVARVLSSQLQHMAARGSDSSTSSSSSSSGGTGRGCTASAGYNQAFQGADSQCAPTLGPLVSSKPGATRCQLGTVPDNRAGGNSGNSITGRQQDAQLLPVLMLPQGCEVVGGPGKPFVQIHTGQQQRQQLMPLTVMTDLVWSVDQHPKCVGQEELEAMVIPCACITLLLPQSGSGLACHASIACHASDATHGITGGELLHIIYSFYQQQVLLQTPVGNQQDGVEQDTLAAAMQDKAGPRQRHYQNHYQPQQQQQQHDDPDSTCVVKRVQLLGHRQLFEGLFRATREPCSSVYEVCLA